MKTIYRKGGYHKGRAGTGTNQKGFTLVELMMVVAIIGILASVGLPVYQGYVAKAKIAKITQTIGASRVLIAEHYVTEGAFPDTDEVMINQVKARLSGTGYVLASGLTYRLADGVATFVIPLTQINTALNGKKITYQFQEENDAIRMSCETDAATDDARKYLSACTSTS